VPKRWYSPYRSAALKEILRNAEASYPVGFPQYIPAGKVPLQRVTAWHRLKLFDEIEAAFAANGMTNHQVARHLTALVFSSRSNVEHHKLKPTPGNVKTNVRDVGRKLGEGKNKNLPAQEI
jgi:hypothetical protein